ncbi:MAG: hypothetical protein A4E57_04519 [Syntrophorhabdaceae bacterium PtaU1.Bin034]|nr:MAG: hypothetical protein A4E57_04519 [Syntrophorhabdaceae bacterium PtaU1.Bin034]
MADEPNFCVICAWRKECQKKFLHAQDVTLRCRDFTKDVTIKKEKVDDKETNRGDDKGGGRGLQK